MESLKAHAEAYGIALTGEMLERFEEYARMLVDWNGRMNLTAINDREGIVVKHFLDSLLLLKLDCLPRDCALIDVGTGAGFPGIPLKIVRSDIRLTLLDSLQKRIGFLSELSNALGQENQLIHGRAEQCAGDPELRERFDVATARAVASLPALSEYCLPFVRPEGVFLAMKGFAVEEELESAGNAVGLLGGEILRCEKFVLPGENKRSVIITKKRSHTPSKYPRSGKNISKNPL